MSLTRTQSLCPVGRVYPDEEAARNSARGREPGAEPFACPRRECGRWHVRTADGHSTPGSGFQPRPGETGFSRRVRLMVRLRAGNGDISLACCENCGCPLGPDGGDIQHRIARGAGGCTDEVINSAANGALLCRPCHRLCEARDPELRRRGFWRRSGKGPEHDPRNIRILLPGPDGGPRRPAWLRIDGSYRGRDGELLQRGLAA